MEPSLTQVRADAFLAEAFALCHLTLSESAQFSQTKQISTHANNRALVRAGEQAMLRITLALFILTVLPSSMRGEPACEDSYASCMASCATDRSAERCMQGCIWLDATSASSSTFPSEQPNRKRLPKRFGKNDNGPAPRSLFADESLAGTSWPATRWRKSTRRPLHSVAFQAKPRHRLLSGFCLHGWPLPPNRQRSATSTATRGVPEACQTGAGTYSYPASTRP